MSEAFYYIINVNTMKTSVIKQRMPLIVACLIIILGAAGMLLGNGRGGRGLSRSDGMPGDDTLSVAIEMNPLTYTLRNDTAEGFDYQLLKDIAAEHGVAVRFTPVAQLDKAFEDLYKHKFDLVIASVPATTELRRYFPLTEAVYLDKQVLVQRRDSAGGRGPILSQEQLLGDTVWVAEGSPFKTRLRNMSKELGDTIYIESAPQYSSEHLAILTAVGEVRRAVVSEAVARHIAAEYPQLDIETPISFNHFQSWVVAPGDSALLDSLNTWIADFRTTPRYRSLAEKYL